MSKKRNYTQAVQRNGQYFILPNEVFRLKLSTYGFAIYAYLVSNAPQFTPSIDLISKALGINRKTVMCELKALEARKLIKVRRNTAGRKNYYELMEPSAWGQNTTINPLKIAETTPVEIETSDDDWIARITAKNDANTNQIVTNLHARRTQLIEGTKP